MNGLLKAITLGGILINFFCHHHHYHHVHEGLGVFPVS